MDRLLPYLNAALPYIVAAIVAYASIGFSLINSKYTNTFFLIKRCHWVYLYPAIFSVYAIVFLGVIGLMPIGFLREHIGVGGHLWDNHYVQASIVGLFITQVIHWNFFKTATEAHSVEEQAIDFGSVFRALEKFVIRKIALSHHYALEQYLMLYITNFTDLEDVRSKAMGSIPTTLKRSERLDIKDKISRATDVHEVLEIYIMSFACQNFENLFGRLNPPN